MPYAEHKYLGSDGWLDMHDLLENPLHYPTSLCPASQERLGCRRMKAVT
jgi:hypothetical protein